MANKSPAFQFYVKDWLASTKVRLMSHAERGAYMDLLCHTWNEDSCALNNDDDELSILSGLGDKWYGKTADKIKSCYTIKGNKLVHERLLAEREKQNGWKEKCKKAGMASGKARRNKKLEPNVSSPHVEHETNIAVCSLQSSSASSSSTPSSKKKKTLPPQAIQLAELLAELILINNPDNTQLIPAKRKSTINRWADDIRKLQGIDKQPWERIEEIIRWCQADTFWESNILSGEALRKKFNQLVAKESRMIPQSDGKVNKQVEASKGAIQRFLDKGEG